MNEAVEMQGTPNHSTLGQHAGVVQSQEMKAKDQRQSLHSGLWRQVDQQGYQKWKRLWNWP